MDENAEFGSNPGNLGMYSCVPRGLAKSSALVVALHGGQQTARDFDLATGWSALGRKHGFAVCFRSKNTRIIRRIASIGSSSGTSTLTMGSLRRSAT